MKTVFMYLSFVDGASFKLELKRTKAYELEESIKKEEGLMRINQSNGLELNYKLRYVVSYAISQVDIDDEKYKKVQIGFTKKIN